jgi:hypothetical protein
VLSLGSTPLANALLTEADLGKPEPKFPLDLVFCQTCTLVQITEEVPPETMFGEYLYFSSFSDTMLKHAQAITARLTEQRKLGPSSLVVEVASNDGYLLQYYKQANVPVLGIEPAKNIAKVAEEKGIRTLARFFGRELATELGEKADVIHANNVLAHVPDLNGVVAGFATLIKDDGVVVVECPWVKPFVDHIEFDTIYHEHLCYFSLHALDALFARHGLVIHDVEKLQIHGGSIRIFASKNATRGPSVAATLEEEKGAGVSGRAYYDSFAARVGALKNEVMKKLEDLKSQGLRVAAYGAAAKGATLANFFGIDRSLVSFVVDRSTYKQGRFMPGTHQPILPPSALEERMPDYCLLFTWNFEAEILEQQKAYREKGGRFIVPIPSLRIV